MTTFSPPKGRQRDERKKRVASSPPQNENSSKDARIDVDDPPAASISGASNLPIQESITVSPVSDVGPPSVSITGIENEQVLDPSSTSAPGDSEQIEAQDITAEGSINPVKLGAISRRHSLNCLNPTRTSPLV